MKETGRLFHYELDMLRGELNIPAGDILQIAELAIVDNSEIKAHNQICDEITYVISGSATVWSGKNQYKISAGQIHYIRKGEYHRIVADQGESFRYCCIGFMTDPNCDEIRCFTDWSKGRADFVVLDEGNINKLFPLLIDESFGRDAESRMMIHFYFCQMLIQIYRILSGGFREKLSRLDTSASNTAVYLALKYMDREYPNLIRTSQVAQAISYSEFYLSHIFRERMGMTIKDYLMRKKIKMAVELLKTSSMTVTEIAETLSFSTLHSFHTAFKRYMQISPREFRCGATPAEQKDEALEMK